MRTKTMDLTLPAKDPFGNLIQEKNENGQLIAPELYKYISAGLMNGRFSYGTSIDKFQLAAKLQQKCELTEGEITTLNKLEEAHVLPPVIEANLRIILNNIN